MSENNKNQHLNYIFADAQQRREAQERLEARRQGRPMERAKSLMDARDVAAKEKAFGQPNHKPKRFHEYQEMRRNNPSKFYRPEVQQQMMQDRESLGVDVFMNRDPDVSTTSLLGAKTEEKIKKAKQAAKAKELFPEPEETPDEGPQAEDVEADVEAEDAIEEEVEDGKE